MSVEELLPCPFCGGEASLTSEYWYKGDRKGGEVHCFGCRVQIGRKQLVTDPEPAAAWNRRTPPAMSARAALTTGEAPNAGEKG